MAAGSVSSLANESRESEAAYRPHLDGLRAVAVYLVVLFHSGLGSFSGGYIGVDVFFVLSGFLVTQLLLRDIHRSGAVRFGRFYSRRFRRLLPAAFVSLIVTALVFTAIVSASEVSAAVGSFKAAFLYSANWYFIHKSHNYFGADVSTNPVLHFWSLAVEEQFYLIWPLALGGVYTLTRRLDPGQQLRTIRIVVGAGALASALWALSLRTTDLNRAYYGTDTRAYELLAGASIALTPAFAVWAGKRRRATQIATLAGGAALLLVASGWVHLDAIERGIAVTITTCVLIVAVEAAEGGVVKRLLSTRPVVYLGKISYGTYLWHWLVILVAVRTFHLSPIATLGVACLLATGLASLSFEILERPVRTSPLLDRHRQIVIAAGLAITVVSALVFVPKLVNPAHASKPRVGPVGSALLTPVPKHLGSPNESLPFPKCVGKPVSKCTIVKGPGRHILLMGDSHAWMLIPLFTALAHREGLTLSVSVEGACPWQRGLFTPGFKAACEKLQHDVYKRVIPELHPDIVVVVDFGYGARGRYPLLEDLRGHRTSDATTAKATEASVAALRRSGRDVLLVEPVPLPSKPTNDFDPFTCLEQAKVEEECRYITDPTPQSLDLLYRRVAEQNHAAHHDYHVRSLNLDPSVCPLLPTCDPVVNGQIVKFDQSHLTVKFAQTLVPEVDTYLKSVGFIPD